LRLPSRGEYDYELKAITTSQISGFKPMTAKYPAIKDWSTFPQITMDEFAKRFPQVMKDPSIADLAEFMDDHADDSVIVIPGDVTITKADLAKLAANDRRYARIAVEGNLHVMGMPTHLLYVQGDLHCDYLSLDDSLLVVEGQVFVKFYASIYAEDDGAMREAPTLRITAPFLFAWFYQIDRLTLAPETIIFILGDSDYCDALSLPNLIFSWHRAVYVLKPQFADYVGDAYHDLACWNLDAISTALENGHSIFIDGFSVKAMQYQRDADELANQKNHRSAYLSYKKVADLFPAYYPAWYAMAEQLRAANAFSQALSHYQEAVKRFPEDQKGLLNYAAEYGALAAIRSKDFETAVGLATHALEHNQSERKASRSNAYRFRAEALYRMGRMPEAMADLDAALALNEHHATANWLKGLLLYRAGETALAEKYRQIAANRDKAFDVSYDSADDSDFLVGKATSVDWDTVDISAFEPPAKDETYWRSFLRGSDAMQIKRVPVQMRSTALCMDIVAANLGDSAGSYGHVPAAAFFPAASFTRELAELLVHKNSWNLDYVPTAMIDKSLCMMCTLRTNGGFNFAKVPSEIVDHELCLHAARCGAALDTLPTAWVDKAICLVAIDYHPYAIEKLPPGLYCDEMVFASIASGDAYFFDNKVPSRYKKTDTLKRAIAYDKRALDSISGNRFDAELLAHAQQLYGQDADWKEIVARHDQAFLDKNKRKSASEFCWSAFWDEDFMLRHIQRQNYGLSPYEIPAGRYTQAIAEACFKREPIHLDSIPKQFITPAMSEMFSARYADMLDHIPVALRTQAICARAVKADAKLIALVPLSKRTLDLCVQALKRDAALHVHLPRDTAVAIYDALIQKQDKELNSDWLHVRRGDAKLNANPRDLDGAMDDFRKVAASTLRDSIDQGYVNEAVYLMGYCHYLRGEGDIAMSWRNKLVQQGDEQADQQDDWPDYADKNFSHPSEVVDFAQKKFDELMHDHERAVEIGDFQGAYECVLEAEQMLHASGKDGPTQWAFVLDKNRFVTYELGLWDENIETCRAAVERLSDKTLWAYSASDDVIRHTLRGAYHRLGCAVLDAPPPTLAALREGLALQKKAMILVGPCEDKSCIYPFYDGHAALLLALTAHDQSYEPEANRVLDTIVENRLVDQGLVSIASVVLALDRRSSLRAA
jgi:tetratricopeptide (TPR) repeat protein